MGTKPSPRDNELYQRVDEVLHYLWDPIGVSWEPNARDEYHHYLPHVFALLSNSADEKSLAAYFMSVATDRMGFSATEKGIDNCHRIAELLLTWRGLVWEKYEGANSVCS